MNFKNLAPELKKYWSVAQIDFFLKTIQILQIIILIFQKLSFSFMGCGTIDNTRRILRLFEFSRLGILTKLLKIMELGLKHVTCQWKDWIGWFEPT